MDITPVKRALISVSNKDGIVEFAHKLTKLGVNIISTGGTSHLLTQARIPHQQVEEVTGLAAMLDGRVKTLHPKVHGGILGKRDVHAAEAKQLGIDWIDLVVVNFYPFAEVNQDQSMPWDELVEYIDIGGPTMVRAAAKNFAWVTVITQPEDYSLIVTELETQNGITAESRLALAEKAFAATAAYDAMIQQYFIHKRDQPQHCPAQLNLQLNKSLELRYGENPHQKACAYQFQSSGQGILSAKQHQGKPLSYNNILDAEAAWQCVSEFSAPAAVIIKHANPCGVATAKTIELAYTHAYQADSVSAFGGVLALNETCSEEIATAITTIFMEVILAPAYSEAALTIFATKPNLRILQMPSRREADWEMKFITGGMLLQEQDPQVITQADLSFVTQVAPSITDIDEMLFAWRVLKHIKSNAILIAKQNMTIGIGAGQVSRIDAVDMAIRKAKNNLSGTVLASDAFFPFRDSIDRIAAAGIKAIIQPGGSVRDEEVIAACNEHQIAMVFTGKRCFRH